MHILWSSSGTEMDGAQAQRKKANKSITENYSWAGILQNVHTCSSLGYTSHHNTPSLQEQEVSNHLFPSCTKSYLLIPCMSGTH